VHRCRAPRQCCSSVLASSRWRGPGAKKDGGHNPVARGACQGGRDPAAYHPPLPAPEILSELPHLQVGRLLLIKPESFGGAVGQRLNRLTLIIAHLPCSTIITSPGKMPAIISLSCTRICGEEDFRCRG